MNLHAAPEPPVAWQGLLGYLNFSEGRPDPRFHGQLHAAYRLCAQRGPDLHPPPATLADLLDGELTALQSAGGTAFRDVTQARTVIQAALRELPTAYRTHHRDLLATVSDADLFQPFFLARACEAVLGARGDVGGDVSRLTDAALRRLNDYVGYRPVAVLENRRAGEVYAHERLRPVPLFLRTAGAAAGRYQSVVVQALTILSETDADLLEEAQFDLERLDELAIDPRPYDHNHPANKRPNHVFGEWDPDLIDLQGHYRRFVIRQTTLDALLARISTAVEELRAERQFDVAAVLAGTMLMASALNGRGPNAYDSSSTLSTVVPRIAQLRDAFYTQLLSRLEGPRAERLRLEAEQTRQPFGGTRQHLNQVLAQDRALQLQEHHLAHLFAALGYPSASRGRADRIATASVRIAASVRARATTAVLLAGRGRAGDAADQLADAESLLRRGIDCGALPDPWNMLGFQGLFPLFHSREDSVHDQRIEELLFLVGGLFEAYAAALGEAAAHGQADLRDRLKESVHQFADWWDQFAGYEVHDLSRVHGGDAAASAEHVATALAHWRQRGASGGVGADIAFWRGRLDGFRTAAAFGRVVAALLDRDALPAALALLMTWLSRVPEIPLEDADTSFDDLAERWLRAACAQGADRALAERFFELLESNAEAYWHVPELFAQPARTAEDADDVVGAAYESMTYRDSADDGTEGAVLGDAVSGDDFPLEHEAETLRPRLRFLATVARLWRSAADAAPPGRVDVAPWLATARARQGQFQEVLDRLHGLRVPDPLPGFEAAVEFDRRRAVREQLIEDALAAALANEKAVRALAAHTGGAVPPEDGWAPLAAAVEGHLARGEPGKARVALRRLLPQLRREPLLYIPVSAGGHPQQIFAARNVQSVLHQLMERLPRLGLLREAFQTVQTARAMERAAPPEGRKVTEFDRLFPVALQASVHAVLDLADRGGLDGATLPETLRRLTGPYLVLWVEHSQTLRLSVLETVESAGEWNALGEFVRTHGRELFTAGFLHLANLRAVLHRGVEAWVDSLDGQDDPPETFLAALGGALPRARAVQHVEIILQAVVENYDEYRDYNTTTTQSDYGDNLHVLLDFFRLKLAYDRDQWRLRPLVIVHEVLCRRGRTADAERWQESIVEYTQPQADRHLHELGELESRHGLRLRSIRDHLGERFVAPLVIDRLCALLGPAWEAAKEGRDERSAAFERLHKEIVAFSVTPTGAGLEVPVWLRRLEAEAERLRRRTEPPPPPPSRLTLDGLRAQLETDWTKLPDVT